MKDQLNKVNNLKYYKPYTQPMRQEVVEGTEIQQEYSCCNGKIFFITDKKQVIATFLLTTIVLLLHQIFHISWFSTKHQFFPLYVLFITHFTNFWSFLAILTSNPGIIQKIAYEYENEVSYLDVPKNELSRSHIQIANIMAVRSNLSKIKLCSTCNIYRPPRTHHCSECGVCIERMDHHCPWLGVCIGKYNYKYFYCFLISLLTAIIVTAAMCISMMAQDSKVYPLAIILVLLCFPAFLFVGLMFCFHTYISCLNLTTKEFLDDFWSEVAGNPNKKPLFMKNFLKTFFIKTERQIKYKYVQYYVKSEGQSLSEQKISSQNNRHSLSRDSQKRSSSDDNNISKDRKSEKQKSDQKQNSFDSEKYNKSIKFQTEKNAGQMSKISKLNNQKMSQSQVLKENNISKGLKKNKNSQANHFEDKNENKSQKIKEKTSIIDDFVKKDPVQDYDINIKVSNNPIIKQ